MGWTFHPPPQLKPAAAPNTAAAVNRQGARDELRARRNTRPTTVGVRLVAPITNAASAADTANAA